MKTAVCLALIVLGGTGGDLCFAHAMKHVGEMTSFGWTTVSHMFRQAVRLPAIWVGIALHIVAFVTFVALLTWADVSFVVPATALSYAVGAAGAALILGERVTSKRWAGIVLISSGVLLVLLG